MIELFDWVATHAQIDIGNFAVGVATAIVAFITLYVSIRNIKAQSNHKVAEFRVAWIDDLRVRISEFVATSYEAVNERTSLLLEERDSTNLDALNAKVRAAEFYVQLCLNREEELHRDLIDHMAQIRGRVAHYSNRPTADLSTEIDEYMNKMSVLARAVLKKEWDRATNEVHKN